MIVVMDVSCISGKYLFIWRTKGLFTPNPMTAVLTHRNVIQLFFADAYSVPTKLAIWRGCRIHMARDRCTKRLSFLTERERCAVNSKRACRRDGVGEHAGECASHPVPYAVLGEIPSLTCGLAFR